MDTVSIFRLYLLRAGYLLLAVGEGMNVWPAMTYHASTMELWHGVAISLLWAMCVLAILGIRYPLRMLPILFFEITWKTAWLLAVALPNWLNGTMTAGLSATAFACSFVVIFWIIIPWSYVFGHYVKLPGDPWRRAAKSSTASPV